MLPLSFYCPTIRRACVLPLSFYCPTMRRACVLLLSFYCPTIRRACVLPLSFYCPTMRRACVLPLSYYCPTMLLSIIFRCTLLIHVCVFVQLNILNNDPHIITLCTFTCITDRVVLGLCVHPLLNCAFFVKMRIFLNCALLLIELAVRS